MKSFSNWYRTSTKNLQLTTYLGPIKVAQIIKNLPAVWENLVWSLTLEDPLKKGMATHSSVPVWRIPWPEEPGRLQSTGWKKVGHDWVSTLSLFNSILGFPGGFRGKESACQWRRCKRRGFNPWVRKISWRRKCNPLQHSYLENPMDRRAWWATPCGVTKSQSNVT